MYASLAWLYHCFVGWVVLPELCVINVHAFLLTIKYHIMKKLLFLVVLTAFSTFAQSPESLSVTNPQLQQNLPYPIIFIHGLNGSSQTWDDQAFFMLSEGLTFGGRIDACLNYDINSFQANKLVYPAPNADIRIFTNESDLEVADFYTMNFDVDVLGNLFPSENGSPFFDVLSNESAIAKQGVALKYAIQMVLSKTGKQKVILMGHSMGGLCAREYIQTTSNWQTDGYHHVAKLITTGTPHGGYTGTNVASLSGIDSGSEAYRDLRKEYSNSNIGVFLFGGNENIATIGTSFYNNDINCNTINNDNSTVLGLNQKNLYNDIDYAYIIGLCTGCIPQGIYSGDGIVREENANLSNFYILPTPKNEYIHNGASTLQTHTDLTKQVFQNMQGLDEPNEYNVAYGIEPAIIYKGLITTQPIGGYQYDYDDYKITITSSGNYEFNFVNTYAGSLNVRVRNSSFTDVATTVVAPNSFGTISQNLTVGIYYLETYATPSAISYQNPYSFTYSATLSNDIFTDNETVIYPNPIDSTFFIKSNYDFDKVEIYNVLGQLISSYSNYENGIDISSLTSGNYLVKLHLDSTVILKKINKK